LLAFYRILRGYPLGYWPYFRLRVAPAISRSLCLWNTAEKRKYLLSVLFADLVNVPPYLPDASCRYPRPPKQTSSDLGPLPVFCERAFRSRFGPLRVYEAVSSPCIVRILHCGHHGLLHLKRQTARNRFNNYPSTLLEFTSYFSCVIVEPR
jgi:hypothetical protein